MEREGRYMDIADSSKSETASSENATKSLPSVSAYENGRDEPCEICGDGGHTEIGCPNG